MTVSPAKLSRLIRECAPTWEGTIGGRRVRLEKVLYGPGDHFVRWAVCVNRRWLGGDAATVRDACEAICSAVETRLEAE